MFNLSEIVGKRSDLDEVKTEFTITLTAAKNRLFQRMIQRAVDLDPERNTLDYIMSQIANQLATDFEEQEEKERAAAERKKREEEEAERKRQEMAHAPTPMPSERQPRGSRAA